MSEFIKRYETIIIRIIIAVGVLLAAFLLVATLLKAKETRYVGSGLQATNTISVMGKGEIDRAPDTAKVTFTVRQESPSIKTAQTTVSGKIDKVTEALKKVGIDEKHIKTESYSSYPQYNYYDSRCIGISCPKPNAPTIRGYEVSHMVTVAIKNLDTIDQVLAILGQEGVSDIQGPNFGFEDDTEIMREARDKAIDDAKEEARKLARSLDVELVRIVSFNEQGSGMPVSTYVRNQALDAKAEGGSTAVSLPLGEQNVASTVTIVYEIR